MRPTGRRRPARRHHQQHARRGGESIIPIQIFIFGAAIGTAGTASVLISLPVVLTGVARQWLTGHYRSQSMLAYLVPPMCIGSLIGASVAFKLWSKQLNATTRDT